MSMTSMMQQYQVLCIPNDLPCLRYRYRRGEISKQHAPVHFRPMIERSRYHPQRQSVLVA